MELGRVMLQMRDDVDQICQGHLRQSVRLSVDVHPLHASVKDTNVEDTRRVLIPRGEGQVPLEQVAVSRDGTRLPRSGVSLSLHAQDRADGIGAASAASPGGSRLSGFCPAKGRPWSSPRKPSSRGTCRTSGPSSTPGAVGRGDRNERTLDPPASSSTWRRRCTGQTASGRKSRTSDASQQSPSGRLGPRACPSTLREVSRALRWRVTVLSVALAAPSPSGLPAFSEPSSRPDADASPGHERTARAADRKAHSACPRNPSPFVSRNIVSLSDLKMHDSVDLLRHRLSVSRDTTEPCAPLDVGFDRQHLGALGPYVTSAPPN